MFEDDLSHDCSFSACSKYCLITFLQLNVICAACNYQTSSGFHSLFELQQPMVEKINAELTDPYFPGPISGEVVCFYFSIYFASLMYKGILISLISI